MNDKYNFKSIYEIIRDRIVNEEYIYSSLMPSEITLSEEFGVSRPTAAKVYKRLEREHLVKRIRGRGTLVTKEPANAHRNYTFGLLLPGRVGDFFRHQQSAVVPFGAKAVHLSVGRSLCQQRPYTPKPYRDLLFQIH